MVGCLFRVLCVEQLSVDKATVVAAIQALSQVYLECSKRLLSQSAFVLSVSELQFTDEQQEIASEVRRTTGMAEGSGGRDFIPCL